MPAKDKESGAKSGDDRVWMLQQYNSTLAAIDVVSGKARVLVDAKSEPRPNRMDLSPSGR